MTNRQWLIWRLIDMSDEEFAEGIAETASCGHVMIAKSKGLMTTIVMAVKKIFTHG